MSDQNEKDLEASDVPAVTPASDETTSSQTVPGPAATSMNPTVAASAAAPADQSTPATAPVAVTEVAPTDPSVPPFINPDPDSAITEPPKLGADGTVEPVVAPANQPSPVSPQVVAQEEAKAEAEKPPTIKELAACANSLRTGMSDDGGHKVAALLDRVAQRRIDKEQAELDVADKPAT